MSVCMLRLRVLRVCRACFFFFFKQKTAYEMRISDWSSDVCSSDLLHALVLALSVAWQAFAQDAPHLYVTAAIALLFKAIVIPVALQIGRASGRERVCQYV